MADAADHRLASALALGAGRLLVRIRERLAAQDAPVDVVRLAGDLAAHQYLVDRLGVERPGDAVLSEEHAADDLADRHRLAADRVWIVDPLDGTREFGEGRDDWAVHVALVEDHAPSAGAVALPALGVVLDTAAPPVLPQRAPIGSDHPLRIAVSRSRPPAIAAAVATALGATEVPMGSAGAKVMAVVRGDADAYVHGGGQYQWDNCAPAAVAIAAGVTCTRLDGSALRYNEPELELPDLLVCRPELTDVLRQAIDAAATGAADHGDGRSPAAGG